MWLCRLKANPLVLKFDELDDSGDEWQCIDVTEDPTSRTAWRAYHKLQQVLG